MSYKAILVCTTRGQNLFVFSSDKKGILWQWNLCFSVMVKTYPFDDLLDELDRLDDL